MEDGLGTTTLGDTETGVKGDVTRKQGDPSTACTANGGDDVIMCGGVLHWLSALTKPLPPERLASRCWDRCCDMSRIVEDDGNSGAIS